MGPSALANDPGPVVVNTTRSWRSVTAVMTFGPTLSARISKEENLYAEVP